MRSVLIPLPHCRVVKTQREQHKYLVFQYGFQIFNITPACRIDIDICTNAYGYVDHLRTGVAPTFGVCKWYVH
jgi:hypothetical protein